MKKIIFILAAAFLLMCNLSVNAQDNSNDYFVGTWELFIEDTPEGDITMVVNLERKDDGKLTGTITDKSNAEKAITISSVEEKTKDITVNFTSDSGYDVFIFIEKGGDNDVSGNIMNMFDFKGKRSGKKD